MDNPAVNKPSEDKNSTAADSLEKMIIKATSEPETKKDKRQERADMMLSEADIDEALIKDSKIFN